MRILSHLGLLLLASVAFSGVCFAGDQSQPTQPPLGDKAQPTVWNGVIHSDGSGIPGNEVKVRDSRDQFCLKMRSYLVRQDPGSDVVRPAGYRTCLPGTRIEMRTTESPEPATSY